MKSPLKLLICLFVISSLGVKLIASDQAEPQMKTQLEENQAYSKGHIGIITHGLYIVVSSDKNELILGDNPHVHWFGLPSSDRQVVIIFKGQVVNADKLPSNYSLEKATLISFEESKIRFIDFPSNEIGFYLRIPKS
jgi:hypothetical protein